MGSYIKRPAITIVGRDVEKTHTIERIIEKESSASLSDIQAIANAVAKAISFNLPTGALYTDKTDKTDKKTDNFDNSNTMENLAKSMIVQRGKSESNFDSDVLGNVERTKSNPANTDKIIDLLGNLED